MTTSRATKHPASRPNWNHSEDPSISLRRDEQNIEYLRWKRGNDADAEGSRVPRLIPLFPLDPGMTPTSPCGHKKPIKRGSIFVCMVCHQSGWDGHPDLVIGPDEMPSNDKPDDDPKHRLGPEPKPEAKETRKQRRARLHGKTLEQFIGPDDTAPDPAVAESA